MNRHASLDNAIDAKVAASAVAAYLSTLIAGLLANAAGVDIDPTTLEALLLPGVVAALTFAVGWLKRDPRFDALIDFYRRGGQEPPDAPEEVGAAG